jgi:uncharacterized membrane protein
LSLDFPNRVAIWKIALHLRRRKTMSIGPLQMVIIGFENDTYARDIVAELRAARQQGSIRLFDMLYLIKHADGTVASKQVSDLTPEEKETFGRLVSRLIGLGAEGIAQDNISELADSLRETDADYGLTEAELQGLAAKVPNGSSAIAALFEHHWALNLRETIVKAGGKLLVNAYINPDTLKVASQQLNFVLDAVNRVEATAIDAAAAIRAEAQADADAARAAAEAATQQRIAAEQAAAEAEEKARRIKQAAALQALSALKAAKLVAAEAEEEAMKALSEAELIKMTAADEAALVITEAKAEEERVQKETAERIAAAQAMEDEAFAQAEAVRRAAQRQEANAMAEAEIVVAAAKEMEAAAVLKAIRALVAADIVQEAAEQRAIEAIVAANVVEELAARKAATALLASGM